MAKLMRWAGFLAVVALVACGAPDRVDWVAKWESGSLSTEELDVFILALPPDERRVDSSDPVEWWSSMVHRAAVDEVLSTNELEGDITAIDELLRGALRSLCIDAYLDDRFGPTQVEESEIESLWEELESDYQVSERRELYTIFKRFDGDREEVVAAIENVRRRIVGGEAFGSLAVELSDSETRNRRGRAGIFEKYQLPEAAAEIIFNLEEGVVSEALVTKNGVHLFLVTLVIPETTTSLDEHRSEIEAMVSSKIRDQRLQDTVLGFEESLQAGESELDDEAIEGNLETIIVSIGDQTLRTKSLVQVVDRESLSAVYRPIANDSATVDRIANEELVFQSILRSSDFSPQTLERMAFLVRAREVARAFEQRMRATVSQTELEAFWATNSSRLLTATTGRLVKLEVPLGSSPVETMTRLERARVELDVGRLELGALAAQLDGEVTELGWLNVDDLAQWLPGASSSVFALAPGYHSSPYSNGSSIILLKLVEAKSMDLPELAQVRDQVLDVFVSEEGPRLRQRTIDSILGDEAFAINPQWLEGLATN